VARGSQSILPFSSASLRALRELALVIGCLSRGLRLLTLVRGSGQKNAAKMDIRIGGNFLTARWKCQRTWGTRPSAAKAAISVSA
jgi:hypothetical protein